MWAPVCPLRGLGHIQYPSRSCHGNRNFTHQAREYVWKSYAATGGSTAGAPTSVQGLHTKYSRTINAPAITRPVKRLRMTLDADALQRVAIRESKARYREGTGSMSKYFRVGFTGTRQMLGGDQQHWLEQEMKLLDIMIRIQLGKVPTLHHGDCVGGDAAAHKLARELGWRVCVHPPIKARYRAYCEGASKTFREAGYLARNDAIVRACSLLLAVPGTPLIESDAARTLGLEARVAGALSGTWYTVIRAMEAGIETRICGTAPW